MFGEDKIRSYINVAKATKFVNKKTEGLNVSPVFVTILICEMAGIDTAELSGSKWRGNNYLKDSLELKQIPSQQEISQEIANFVCTDELKSLMNTKETLSLIQSVKILSNKFLKEIRDEKVIRKETNILSLEQRDYLLDNGYLIIKDVLTQDQVDKLSELTLMLASSEDRDGCSYRYGGEDNNLQRVYNLISKHPVFIELLELPVVVELLEFYFDKDTFHHKYVLSSFQSNIIHPGGPAQPLHVDGWGTVCGTLPNWPTRLNVNFLLTDFTEDNGATMVLPSSHKLLRIPQKNEVPDSRLKKLIAPKGSLVLWTGHTWHKSGANRSQKPRFGLFACFAASQLKEASTEEEHLTVVDKEVLDSLSPEMKFMVGLGRGVKAGSDYRLDFTGTKFASFSVLGDK